MENGDVQQLMTRKQLDISQTNVVIYHGNCSDGFGSAFIIWLYLKSKGVDITSVMFVPAHHLQESQQLFQVFVDKFKDKNVVICDFSYRPSQLLKIISYCKSIMILDHHKTAQTDLVHIPTNLKIFDMNRSGVGITWDVFFPGEKLPKFLAHIQDRDLWAHKLPETTDFVTFFYEQGFDFEQWEKYLSDEEVSQAINRGREWQVYQKIIIGKMVKKASYFMQRIDGKINIVLYVNSSEFKSDIGNTLLEKYPFGDFSVVWDYNAYRDQTAISLRSTNVKADVSLVAKKLGGGGHRNASGVILTECKGLLPFEKVDDKGVLGLLANGKSLVSSSNGKSVSYALFKTKYTPFDSELLGILKSYFKNESFLVFQEKTDMQSFDKIKSEFSTLYDYTVLFNEKATMDPSAQLIHEVLHSSDSVLSFESELEMDELFMKMFNIPDNEIQQIISDEEDNLDLDQEDSE